MRKLPPIMVACLALAAAAACGSDSGSEPAASGSAPAADSAAAKPLEGMKVEVAAKWTGDEQANFEKVLKAFEEKTGATVTYASTGEDTGAYLGPRIQGGNPPDVAILPQPAPARTG